ncbi:hypothetical protein [Curtobacterium sp. SGAir0471]|uniref:hypothetical protein n=1 Tax=Curtobacterium sp. SGAir0471 TaxID=2070337 RepID=UPI0010F777D4|nr:hypothetical protein [Curtobacterium sp. SGAir0471]
MSSAHTPWYGPAPSGRVRGPRPSWVLPVVAVAIGAGALLVGGGVGFAVGHAVGTHQAPAVPGGTQQLPGGGGAEVFPDGSQGTGS